MYTHFIPPSKAITEKGYKMNKSQIAANVTISIAFILFFVLLIAGMVTMSIAMIISSFVIGFIGFAIVDHEASVEYDNSGDDVIKQ